MSGELPNLPPRPHDDGELPALAPRGGGEGGLPPLGPRPRPPEGGLPPLGSGNEARAQEPPPPPPGRARPGRRHLRIVGASGLAALALLGAGAVGGLTVRALDDDPQAATNEGAPTTTTTITPPTTERLALQQAVLLAKPSVVTVRSPGSQGSGVITASRGLIVTNEHVVDGAEAVTIVTSDGRNVPAEVVASDANVDLAILRPEQVVAQGARLAPEPDGGLQVGDTVFAIGSPFGLEGTVTAGVVSETRRTQSDNGLPMIQTDTPINPGNSGGGLFDLRGRLVGIPTSIGSPIPGNIGIGFAVPVTRVQQLLDTVP